MRLVFVLLVFCVGCGWFTSHGYDDETLRAEQVGPGARPTGRWSLRYECEYPENGAREIGAAVNAVLQALDVKGHAPYTNANLKKLGYWDTKTAPTVCFTRQWIAWWTEKPCSAEQPVCVDEMKRPRPCGREGTVEAECRLIEIDGELVSRARVDSGAAAINSGKRDIIISLLDRDGKERKNLHDTALLHEIIHNVIVRLCLRPRCDPDRGHKDGRYFQQPDRKDRPGVAQDDSTERLAHKIWRGWRER